MRAALVFVALVGCVKHQPPYKAEVDGILSANTRGSAGWHRTHSDETKPWRVGQWALYSRTEGKEYGYKTTAVVAEDSCGIWIQELVVAPDHRWQWLYCFRREATMPDDPDEALDRLQVVITKWNTEPRTVLDFRDRRNADQKGQFKGLVSRLFLPSWRRKTDLPPGDIDVAAGHFVGAIHSKAASTDRTVELDDWFHTEVPFDGTLREDEPHLRLHVELLSYGDAWASDVIPALETQVAAAERPKPQPRLFFGFGYITGWFSGHGAETSSSQSGAAFADGIRVTRNLEVIANVLSFDVGTYAPDPSQTQTVTLVMPGVRWAPFGPAHARYPDIAGASALYLEGDVGYAELVLTSSTTQTTLARGVAGSLAVGWLGVQSEGWAIGLALRDDVMLLNRSEGIRNDLAATAIVQLHFSIGQ